MLFDDLAVCVANPGDDKDKLDKFNLLVSKIKNTMTDRCAVNKAFIPLLEKLREDILPNILPNFSHLDSETQKNLIQIHDWYCGYHVLLGISDSADSGLKVFESVSKSEDMEPISTWKLKNSETYDFIKSVCDLLQSPGSKTMGRAPLFTAYLNNKGKSNQLIPFYGNRFNLLFKDAAMVLHHYEDIKDFLVNKLDADNLLIKKIKMYLESDIYLAGVSALSKMYYAITEPVERLLNSNKTVTNMVNYYKILDSHVTELAEDASPLLSDSYVMFDDFEPGKFPDSPVCTNNDDFHCLTQEALEVILISVSILLKRQLSDYLGGKHSNPDQSLVQDSLSAPSSSISAEHNFGQWDYLLRNKPNANTCTLESIILYKRNNTHEWLATNDELALREKASKLRPLFVQKRKERAREIKLQRLEKLERAKKQEQEKEEKMTAKKIHINDIIEKQGGRCTSVADVEKLMSRFSTISDKKKALQNHLTFYKDVLCIPPCEPKIYQFSDKEIGQFNVDILFENLVKVIQFSNTYKVSDKEECTEYVASAKVRPRLERQPLLAKEKEKLFNKAEKQAQKLEPVKKIVKPEQLIEKKIKHKWTINNKSVWLTGFVIGLSKHKPMDSDDEIKIDTEEDNTCFTVKYNKYKDKVFHYRLLPDAKSGDLKLV